jgi:hypothetical protein
MVPLKELLEKFSDHKIIENTESSSPCNFEFNLKHPKTKHTIQTVEKMICNYLLQMRFVKNIWQY